MKTILFIAVALFGFAAALEFDRACRTIPVVNDFSMSRYAGNWYEIKRYETTLQDNGDCSTFDYSYDFEIAEPTELYVTVRWSYADHSERYHYGNAVLAGAANEGRMRVTWEHRPADIVNYHVVATDYENYSVLWHCEDLPGGGSNEDAWVLSKSQELDEGVRAEVAAIVAQYLDEGEMRYTYQGANCLNIEG